MTDLLNAVIGGTPIGCVFALMAVGLVLTYRTAGVFNLAFGAQAFVSAAVYYDTRVRHEWPIWAALVLSVFVIAPLLGYVLDRALFRHLRTASSIAKLVTTLGLVVAIPEITKLWFGRGASFGVKGIWPTTDEIGGPTIYRWGDYAIDGNQVATVLVTVVAVLGLTALFRWSQIGLRMRATVESPRMTELAGINADQVSSIAWILSSLFAGFAGVLLAPLFSQVSDANFLFLLIAAMAAAAFGSLKSIPLTLIGGLALGIGYQVLYEYLPRDSILGSPQALRPALPFGALFLLLLFWPGLRNRREAADPLSGVDPPPPAPAATLRTRSMTTMTRVLARRVLRVPLPRGGHLLRRLLGAALHHGDRLRRHLLLDHRDHRHVRPALALPGQLRRHRRLHDRPTGRRASTSRSWSPSCSAPCSPRWSAGCSRCRSCASRAST